jgi:hypothetical protein
MSRPSTNKATGPSFSVASLFLIVGIFAVCFAVARVARLVGVVMIAATVPALVAVAVSCFTRRSQRVVGPLALFFIVSAITFVLTVWWSAVGWTLGFVADFVGIFIGDFENAAAAGATAGLALGVLCGLVAAVDLVLFVPRDGFNDLPLEHGAGQRGGTPAPRH